MPKQNTLKPLKIMLIAGEASGDILAADVMAELKKQQPNIDFIGVGGSQMAAHGLKSVFPMQELSLMGLFEVLPHIPHLFKRAGELVTLAKQEQPDILLTVDAPDFNLRVAKKIKRACPHMKAIHYVSPSIWAWRRGRVNKMAKFLDHVLALFPFEPKFYQGTSLPCTHVGHPVVQRLLPQQQKTNPETKLAILPGSRESECRRHWQTLVSIMEKLVVENPALQCIVPLPNPELQAYLPLSNLIKHNVKFTLAENRYQDIADCTAALTKSGTSNLELAVLNIPMVVFYQTGNLTYAIARHLINVPYISPVNWVLGKKAIPELLQSQFTPQQALKELRPLLNRPTQRTAQQAQLTRATNLLKAKHHPAKAAAEVILTDI